MIIFGRQKEQLLKDCFLCGYFLGMYIHLKEEYKMFSSNTKNIWNIAHSSNLNLKEKSEQIFNLGYSLPYYKTLKYLQEKGDAVDKAKQEIEEELSNYLKISLQYFEKTEGNVFAFKNYLSKIL